MPNGEAEVYPAISGEGQTLGKHSIFVRLYGCNLKCNFCLVGGTRIRMADGTEKEIQKLERGDKVMSYNPETREFEEDVVSETMNRITFEFELLEICLNNGKVMSITKNHEVLTKSGWVLAGELKEGDEIVVDTL